MIERPIPKEIKDFKEKIVFGLTLRQLIAAVLTLGICVPTYIFGRKYLGDELASWVCILVAVPSVAFGFFKQNGMNFEQYAWAVIKSSVLVPTQRKYKSENFFEELEKKETVEAGKKGNAKKNERSEIVGQNEGEVFEEENGIRYCD